MKVEGCGGFFVIIVFAILFFTNPEKRDHRDEVRNVLQEALSQDIEELLDKYCEENPSEFCSSREDNSLINDVVDGRNNYCIFSLPTVNGDIVGVGILKMVFVSSDKIEEDFFRESFILNFTKIFLIIITV